MSRGDGTGNSPVAASEQQVEHGVDHGLLSKPIIREVSTLRRLCAGLLSINTPKG